jgi:hypothetical protein
MLLLLLHDTTLLQSAAAAPQHKRARTADDDSPLLGDTPSSDLPSTIEQLLTGSSSSASTAAAVEALQEAQPVAVEDSGLTSSLTSLPAAAPRRSGWSHADSSILDKAEAAVKAAVSATTTSITTAITSILLAANTVSTATISTCYCYQ